MKRLAHILFRLFRGRDKGTVTVTFALSLPILLVLVGVMVQYALLANAQLTLDRAVQAGARAAMTSLPTDQSNGEAGGPDNVSRAIHMTLESLSPAGADAAVSRTEAQAVADALNQIGMTLPDRYVERYAYTVVATHVDIQPLDSNGVPIFLPVQYAQAYAPRVRLTVTYEFQITVPMVNIPVGRLATVAGITGRFRKLTSTVDVQLSPGREAQ